MGRVSAKYAVEKLGISHPTLLMWAHKKIVRRYKKRVGGRDYFEYDQKQLASIHAKMKRKLKRGQSYFTKG